MSQDHLTRQVMLLECFGPLNASLLEVCTFDAYSTLLLLFQKVEFKGEFSSYSYAAIAWVHRSKPWCSRLRHSTCTHNATRSSVTQGLCHKSSLSTALHKGSGRQNHLLFKHSLLSRHWFTCWPLSDNGC